MISKKKYFKIEFKTKSGGQDIFTLSNLPIDSLSRTKRALSQIKREGICSMYCGTCALRASLWEGADCLETLPEDVKHTTIKIIE